MIVITTSYSTEREKEQLVQNENSGTKELRMAQRR